MGWVCAGSGGEGEGVMGTERWHGLLLWNDLISEMNKSPSHVMKCCLWASPVLMSNQDWQGISRLGKGGAIGGT